MVNISSRYREVSLNMSIRSYRFDLWRLDIKSLSERNKNKSAMSGTQFVSIGIPTVCWWTMPSNCTYRIAGIFRWVLIFAISRTVYGVAKIKTAIIYSNRNSNVGWFEFAKIKIAKIISNTFAIKSRKFSSAKISRYTVYLFHEESKSFTLLSASPTFIRVILLVVKAILRL